MSRWVASFVSMIRTLFGRRRLERELDEELSAYVELLAEENREAGVASGEARRQARIEAGGFEQLKEQTRDARFGEWMIGLGQDIRYAVRMLRRSPAFSVVAILALTLGIAANTTLFSVVRGILLRPLAYPDADRIGVVYMHFSPQNSAHGPLSMADFLDWRENNHSFAELGIFAQRNFDLAGVTTNQREPGALVSSGFFATLKVAPLAGRTFQPEDDQPGATRVAVVSESFLRDHFNGQFDAIGRSVKLNQQPTTIIGVMPASFQFPSDTTRVWANLTIESNGRRGPFNFHGIGRLSDGVTFGQAQAETTSIGRAIEAANPATYHNLSLPMESLRTAIVGNVEEPLWIMMAAVFFVLSIAIVNVAGLLLARAHARAAEMALRVALGARQVRLLCQLLSESCLLALTGAAGGCAVAVATLDWIRNAASASLPRLGAVQLDFDVLAFTAGLGLFTGVLTGIAPALAVVRGQFSVNSTLRRRDPLPMRGPLAQVEIALSLMLLTAAGLLLLNFARLSKAETGFHAPAYELRATGISIRGRSAQRLDRWGNNPGDIEFFDRLLDRLQAAPGIQAAAISNALPPNNWFDDDTFTIRDQPWSAGQFPSVPIVTISPSYFRTAGISLLSGREFDNSDSSDREPVVIISQAVADHHFPGQIALGHYIKLSQPELTSVQVNGSAIEIPFARIVGVVSDVHYQRFFGDSLETVYRPYRWSSATVANVIVRSTLLSSEIGSLIRREARALEPDSVVNPTRNMVEVTGAAIATPRFQTTLLAAFASVAVTLALTGIYGILAYDVARRRRDIGVRLALGARPAAVQRMIVGHGLRIALMGIAAGELGALWMSRFLRTMRVVGPSEDIWIYGVSAVLLLVGAGVASFVPAQRAAGVDPLESLKCE